VIEDYSSRRPASYALAWDHVCHHIPVHRADWQKIVTHMVMRTSTSALGSCNIREVNRFAVQALGWQGNSKMRTPEIVQIEKQTYKKKGADA